ncbi:hypothetical protein CEP88_09340 [Roseobacter denitrificans]|uniref:hypothetical protein n=1 Tax=Roseobacter denitrificans TaxID=2434 RepID=UPI0005C44B24|nr:hypothetical protein [Roseobacter denitrificans]AVL52783.1 hypothetical protein CEP88_09340 [Roseobacter denitrificans]SFG05580.1 hypothetical protein SAMN05443635_106206 [Roseobacter denitrificans OCh 114]
MTTLSIIAVGAIAISLVASMARCINWFWDTIPGTTWDQKSSFLRDRHMMERQIALLTPHIFGAFAVHCILIAVVILVDIFIV